MKPNTHCNRIIERFDRNRLVDAEWYATRTIIQTGLDQLRAMMAGQPARVGAFLDFPEVSRRACIMVVRPLPYARATAPYRRESYRFLNAYQVMYLRDSLVQ